MLPFIELRTAVWQRERQQAGNKLVLVGADRADPAVLGGRAGKWEAPVVPAAQMAPAVSKAVRAAVLEEDLPAAL
jgi:hypothetical protein